MVEVLQFNLLNVMSMDHSLYSFLLFFLYLSAIFTGRWVILMILTRTVTKSRERMLAAAASILNWLVFYGAVLLFLIYFSKKSWLFHPLFSTGEVEVSVFLIIVAIMIVSLAHRLVKVITTYVLSSVYQHYNIEKGLSYTFNRVFYYTVMIAALGVSLTTVGLDLTALGAVFGVLGIGIGFGMRNVAGNFVSGIIILFERPIEVGEVIEISGKVGKVESIRLRSTIVRTAKEGTFIIPNQYFIEQIIKNRTGSEMLAQVNVSVAYGMDTEKIEILLEEAVKREMAKAEGVLNNPAPDIRFVDFRNKAMDFLIEVPVANFEAKQRFESRLRHSIAALFHAHDIELAPLSPLSGTD